MSSMKEQSSQPRPAGSGRQADNHPQPPTTTTTIITTEHQPPSLFQAIPLILLAALFSALSQLLLAPSYGAIPASIYHETVTTVTLFASLPLSVFLPDVAQQLVGQAYLVPLLAAWTPVVHLLLVPSLATSLGGPDRGAAAIEALTYAPLLALTLLYSAPAFRGLVPARLPGLHASAVVFFPPFAAGVVFLVADAAAPHYLPLILGSSVYATRTTAMAGAAASASALLPPSRSLLFAVLPLFHTLALNPHTQLAWTTARLNDTVSAVDYALVERKEGLTGYLSVLENRASGFRVMRCDHSLLGGEWVPGLGSWPGGKGAKPVWERGPVGEPVYSVFIMLEAVRLVTGKTSDGDDGPLVPDDKAKALVIGLGIGTTPSALVAHGINTTVVEIDPAVVHLAREHFHLPRRHLTVAIEDATLFVQKETARVAAQGYGTVGGEYDYIIHDVFTGGAEPADLFTVEFLQALSDLLKPEGVIAINYASDLTLPAASLVFRTILSVFPTCRLFREDEPPPHSPDSSGAPELANMVLFCRKTPAAATAAATEAPLVFREPTERDFLGSESRRRLLVPRFEIDVNEYVRTRTKVPPGGDGSLLELPDEEPVLRRGKTEALDRWQSRSAVAHWAVMKEVLPDEVWYNW